LKEETEMKNERALEILKGNKDVVEKAVAECREAMVNAYTRSDDVIVTIWLDEDGKVGTFYGNHLNDPEVAVLSWWRGAGGDAIEEDEAQEAAADFGEDGIFQYLHYQIHYRECA
jgi:hypothetical protein